MNFQQLKIIREAARREFNLTEVASTLFTSQSGVSRHIRDLEDELGVEIFIRRGKRLLGMTEPGKALLTIAERILTKPVKSVVWRTSSPMNPAVFFPSQPPILRPDTVCRRLSRRSASFIPMSASNSTRDRRRKS